MIQPRLSGEKRVHVAIMRRSWGLIEKILSGEKVAESRWYKNRYRPWDRITLGDVIYFKVSGGVVLVKAVVTRVLQFSDLNSEKTKKILDRYGSDLGLGDNLPPEIKDYFRDKNYCILVFFGQVCKVKPFDINKAGFGSQATWLMVDDLEKIKVDLSVPT